MRPPPPSPRFAAPPGGLPAHGSARRPPAGFTLLELMVAIGVFVLLAVVLVGLLQSALGTWDAGTARKDVYERSQTVFTMLTRDLQALYAVDVESADDMVYPLFGDFDAAGRSRIRFVKVLGGLGGRAAALFDPTRRRSAAGGGGIGARPEDWEPALAEIAWALDPDPARPILWRAERTWSRSGNLSLFDDDRFNARDFFPSNRGEHVDAGLLYWELLYWTRNTGSWTGARPRRGFGARTAGPEVRWDATRQYDEAFAFHKPVAKDLPLDPVYPEMIRVTIVLQPQVGDRGDAMLVAPIDGTSSEIPVSSTRAFPPPPDYALVGKEWVYYSALTPGALRARRGVRNTKPQAHAAGEGVRTGVTFTTVIPIPMFREGKY